ncbi:MAG: DUF2237 domain-containing protein [Gammaproteobacteria bacterium]|nr:DUF2237 domain-containing protein [Gammaproteobacteria bacterium]
MSVKQKNVFGGPLETCSRAPLTGFYRSGCCDTGADDLGLHAVCAEMTREFLDFSKARGNDLTVPNPAVGFPGLAPGDRWCLCAGRWVEAVEAGCAPRIVLAATNQEVLEHVPLELLKRHALDLV